MVMLMSSDQRNDKADEQHVIQALKKLHSEDHVCASSTEISDTANLPKSRVKMILQRLTERGVIGLDKHAFALLYYLKECIKNECGNI